MKKYENPELTVRLFQNEDIITSSTGEYDNANDNIFSWGIVIE